MEMSELLPCYKSGIKITLTQRNSWNKTQCFLWYYHTLTALRSIFFVLCWNIVWAGLFIRIVLFIFGDSLPFFLRLPPSVLPPWWQWGLADWNVAPTHSTEKPRFISSQEQSSTLRMLSFSSLQRPEISLLALIQALSLLSWLSRALVGSPFAFPGSWFHSEFNEGAELSGQRRVSPPGTHWKVSATCQC